MEQIQKKRGPQSRELDELLEDAPEAPEVQDLKDDLDALLDEIDGVLEENAEEFVKDYIQKGGE